MPGTSAAGAPLTLVADRLPPWAGVLEAVDDATCVYRSATDSLEWLALVIGVLGVDFEILEPAELVTCVRTIGERFARASGGLCSGHD